LKKKGSGKELLHFMSLLKMGCILKYISFLFPKLFFSKKKKGSNILSTYSHILCIYKFLFLVHLQLLSASKSSMPHHFHI